MLVLVCILLVGRYLSLLVGCEDVQTKPFLMAGPQQSFVPAHGARAAQTDLCNLTVVAPSKLQQRGRLSEGAIPLSAWKFMSIKILVHSCRNSSGSLMRTVLVIER